jgi:hypothetical protein
MEYACLKIEVIDKFKYLGITLKILEVEVKGIRKHQ